MAPMRAVPGYQLLTTTAACLSLLIAGWTCGDSQPAARTTVRDFFSAVQSSDSTFITTHVDLDSASGDLIADLMDPARDTSVAEPDWSERLFAALVGEGKLRERWMKSQIVIGNERVDGDIAHVEVSYIDRVTRVQYLTEIRLRQENRGWRIVDFQAND